MKITLALATENDASAIAGLSNEVAQRLTLQYGKGHWSYETTAKGVLFDMKGNSKLLIAKRRQKIVGTLRLATKKPWAIDTAYFTLVEKPLYLTGMAVHPDLQHQGIGTSMLQKARQLAIEWPAQSIRLDAYDADAGAGEFYRKCGYSEMGRVLYKKNPLIYFEILIIENPEKRIN